MKNKSEHTPTPWEVSDMRNDHTKGELIISGGLMKIASFPSNKEGERNAAFIVRAVNSHDLLLALVRAWRNSGDPSVEIYEKKIDEAIAQAEGK